MRRKTTILLFNIFRVKLEKNKKFLVFLLKNKYKKLNIFIFLKNYKFFIFFKKIRHLSKNIKENIAKLIMKIS